jgi:ElaB/YqjD/DUF883 family membrane-anchored ribosome-binding protein
VLRQRIEAFDLELGPGAARDRVRSEVDTRSTQAGEQVGTAAQDTRSVAEHLRSQGKDKPAELADKAAERAEQVGDYLKRSDGDTILRDVEQFGREKPWAVLAGGLAIGIAASRFLKASSTQRYTQRQSQFEQTRRLSGPNGHSTGESVPFQPASIPSLRSSQP